MIRSKIKSNKQKNSTLRYECDETFSDEWCNHTCQENVFRTSIVRNFISRGVKSKFLSKRELTSKNYSSYYYFFDFSLRPFFPLAIFSISPFIPWTFFPRPFFYCYFFLDSIFVDLNLRKLGFLTQGLEGACVHVHGSAFVCPCAWARACMLACSRTRLLIDIWTWQRRLSSRYMHA